MFFDAQEVDAHSSEITTTVRENPTPGRMRTFEKFLANTASSAKKTSRVYQHEFEYANMCSERAAEGYNSGMGEIFRKVSEITPVENAREEDLLPKTVVLEKNLNVEIEENKTTVEVLAKNKEEDDSTISSEQAVVCGDLSPSSDAMKRAQCTANPQMTKNLAGKSGRDDTP